MKKETIKNKKVTIEDLAVMMSKGFSDVDKKFTAVHKMIAEGREETSELARMVAKGFEGVDLKFAEVKRELAETKRDIVEIKDNLASTRGDILAMGDRFTLKYEFYDLSTRVGILEQKSKVKTKNK